MDSIKCEAYLLAIEQGSLTAAGQILGYTQPGITRMIHALEDECGFILLSRTVKGVAATENGKRLLPYFREIVRAQKNALEASQEIQGLHSGVLSIGSYYSVSAMLLPHILYKFSMAYPGIRIKLREGSNRDMAGWLADKSVDCCYAAKPMQDGEYDWLPLLEDELVMWLPPDHPRCHDVAYPVEALAGEPFIMTMPNQDTDIDKLLQTYHVQPDIRFSTVDAYTTWKMVEAGLGCSINQRLIYRDWQGKVVALPFTPPQKVQLGLIVPDMHATSPATRRFIKFLADESQGMA